MSGPAIFYKLRSRSRSSAEADAMQSFSMEQKDSLEMTPHRKTAVADLVEGKEVRKMFNLAVEELVDWTRPA